MAKIKVYLGDDHPSRAGSDAGSTGGPMQLSESPAIHDAAADEYSPSKKRKVAFVETTPQPIRDNAEEPNMNQNQSLPNPEPPSEVPATIDAISAEGDNVEEPHSTLPNSEPPPEIPMTLDVISADAKVPKEMSNKTKKRKTGNSTGKRKKGKNEDPISENQSLGEKVQSDIAVVTRNSPEESRRHTPPIGQVDPSGVDVSTQPPKETKKVRMEVVIVGKESNAALSAPNSAASNSTIAAKRAKSMFYKISTSFWPFTMYFRTESKPVCIHFSSSNRYVFSGVSVIIYALNFKLVPSDSKGKTKKKSGQEKTLAKKSRKRVTPVEPPEANDEGQ